MKRTELS